MDRQYPFFLKVVRFFFPLLERISPALSGHCAVFLFLKPFRFGFTKREKAYLAHSGLKQFQWKAGDKTIKGYKAGKGPEVVCIHGWAGRALQFRLIADALVRNGFSFVSFDVWAHGQSHGHRATLFDFSDALEAALNKCDNPVAVIGHSLGAAATSFFMSAGGRVKAFVSIGAPVIAQDILDDFCKIINASYAVQTAIRNYCIKQFDRAFDEVAMENTFRKVTCPVLALHGENDQDVHVRHLGVLKSVKPQIEDVVVKNAGHRGVLKDPHAIYIITEWLKGRTGNEQEVISGA